MTEIQKLMFLGRDGVDGRLACVHQLIAKQRFPSGPVAACIAILHGFGGCVPSATQRLN